MSLTIIPGYDFEVNETPTHDKFIRAAKGLQISGIDASHIYGSLIGHSFTTSSAVSLPAEGWLWTDGGGNTWVQTENGPVRWGRVQGGWETRRWAYSGATEKKGNKLDVSGGEEEATARIVTDTEKNTDGGVYSFMAHDTCVSGSNPLCVGRGGVDCSIAVDTQYYWGIKSLLRTYGASGADWSAPINYVPGTNYKTFPASVIGQNFSRSLGYVWFHGRNLYGPGSTL
jgi:hypothetical protein